MKLLLVILMVVYVLLAFRFFGVWQQAFRQESNLSAQERQYSWIVLILATLCWPIVVPLAYLELLKKRNSQGQFISQETDLIDPREIDRENLSSETQNQVMVDSKAGKE